MPINIKGLINKDFDCNDKMIWLNGVRYMSLKGSINHFAKHVFEANFDDFSPSFNDSPEKKTCYEEKCSKARKVSNLKLNH